MFKVHEAGTVVSFDPQAPERDRRPRETSCW
jgi:hypothetical protein